MTFNSDLDDSTFNADLKKRITDALVSLLPGFNIDAANVELKIKQGKVALVTFNKKMSEEKAKKLIDAIEETKFQEEFKEQVNKNSAGVTLESISDSQSGK